MHIFKNALSAALSCRLTVTGYSLDNKFYDNTNVSVKCRPTSRHIDVCRTAISIRSASSSLVTDLVHGTPVAIPFYGACDSFPFKDSHAGLKGHFMK